MLVKNDIILEHFQRWIQFRLLFFFRTSKFSSYCNTKLLEFPFIASFCYLESAGTDTMIFHRVDHIMSISVTTRRLLNALQQSSWKVVTIFTMILTWMLENSMCDWKLENGFEFSVENNLPCKVKLSYMHTSKSGEGNLICFSKLKRVPFSQIVDDAYTTI